MKIYIIVEVFNGTPPSLHIFTDLQKALTTCRNILKENEADYEYLTIEEACQEFNRKSGDYFIHFYEEEVD